MFLFCLLSFVVSDFTPLNIRLSDLAQDSDNAVAVQLRKELQDTGIVAVTGIPHFQAVRDAALHASCLCNDVSKAAKTSNFEDATSITTFATRTVFGIPDEIDHGQVHPACQQFDKSSFLLRSLVSKVSDVFVRRLSQVFSMNEAAFLKTVGNRTYHSIEEVAHGGEQLEHFHTYDSSNRSSSSNTIDFHTDQGFFISFTPAVAIDEAGKVSPDKSGKFFIELADGSKAAVNFRHDSLVFMLGDGVNQFVNNKIGDYKLRAVPHALQMDQQQGSSKRVWYGRMFLPPTDAVHPEHKLTYGKLRRLMINSMTGQEGPTEALELGCSRKLYARQLQQDTCKEDEMWCWMRCMPYTDDANPEICKAQGLKFECTSQFNQIWRNEDGHGDYNPMCTAATSWVTPAPTMAPAASTCDADNFVSWSYDASYTGLFELSKGNVVLMWKLVGDEVEMKLAYNGKVGWLSIGIAGVGGSHPGMMGAQVAMAIRNEDETSSVAEYTVHQTLSAFRHWSTPHTPVGITDSSFETDGCYSAMTFRTKSLSGKNLDLVGVNRLVWAVHTSTFIMGYHGYTNRGQIDIDFRETSAVEYKPAPPAWQTAAAAPTAVRAPTSAGHSDHSDHSDHSVHAGDHHQGMHCTNEHGQLCDPDRRRLLFGGHMEMTCSCK